MPGIRAISKLDELGDAVRRLVKSADEPLEVWPPTDEQLLRLSAAMDAPKPKLTMERFAGVLDQRGMERAGTIKEIEASMIGRPSHEPGPGGIVPNRWVSMLQGFPKSPDSTPVYVVNPVDAVSSQYPAALREEAVDAARRFRMPMQKGLGGYAGLPYQPALGNPDPRAVGFAYPRRRIVEPGAAGLAHFGARYDAPGLVEVAAGRGVSPQQFDRVLLHELRHTLEGEGMRAMLPAGVYQDVRLPRSVVSPRKKEYLSRVGEEVARFGDARARYAQHTGRLISSDDEAEAAAEMILSNQHGLGEGFYGSERNFYRAARDADSNVREHQNRLLQRILSIAPIAAGAAAGTQGPINREQERTY
jgi:hypothetical protein